MKIYNDVPAPEEPPERQQFPFSDMTVGSSIVAESTDAERARVGAATWKRRHKGWTYTTRRQPDGSLRIWCTAVPEADAERSEPMDYKTMLKLATDCDDNTETWEELNIRLAAEKAAREKDEN